MGKPPPLSPINPSTWLSIWKGTKLKRRNQPFNWQLVQLNSRCIRHSRLMLHMIMTPKVISASTTLELPNLQRRRAAYNKKHLLCLSVFNIFDPLITKWDNSPQYWIVFIHWREHSRKRTRLLLLVKSIILSLPIKCKVPCQFEWQRYWCVPKTWSYPRKFECF